MQFDDFRLSTKISQTEIIILQLFLNHDKNQSVFSLLSMNLESSTQASSSVKDESIF